MFFAVKRAISFFEIALIHFFPLIFYILKYLILLKQGLCCIHRISIFDYS